MSTLVELSRLQFALTALYHFLFVPLTIGLSVIIAIMETVYVMTSQRIWRRMTQFWGILFGINFAMGVATGITMEFQFGTNWAYYSHYVGDIFGAPLAIEGLMAFFLEATFVGIFFFGWNRISKVSHLAVTWLLALGTNFSALWILIANGWMQNPVGAEFNFDTMRMEVSNFSEVLFNPVAQAKFVHTVSAGYVVGSIFVLAISAYYLLRNRNYDIAIRSMTVAVSFGLAASLSVAVLGDESGYLTGESQKMKLAAMEAMWETELAPAALTIFGFPNAETQSIDYQIKIPYLLGLIATRSFSEPVLGINELVDHHKQRIKRGVNAYSALEMIQKDPKDKNAQAKFKEYESDLGYGLLLKEFAPDVTQATDQQIEQAAQKTVPNVSVLFWSFRGMVACGLFFIFLFTSGFYLSVKRRLDSRWFLHLAFWSLPLPWLSSELGWIVAEYGRQPWVVDEMLPTSFGVSSLTTTDLLISISGFVVFYTILAIVEFYLMAKYIRLGPDGLNYWSNDEKIHTSGYTRESN